MRAVSIVLVGTRRFERAIRLWIAIFLTIKGVYRLHCPGQCVAGTRKEPACASRVDKSWNSRRQVHLQRLGFYTVAKRKPAKPLILWRSQPDSNRCTSLERAMSWASRRWERRGVYPQEPGIIVGRGVL